MSDALQSQFTEETLREEIARSNAAPLARRLSLYVHVPYCFGPCFHCGCNRSINRDRSRARPYLERLKREIRMLGNLFERDHEAVQVHLGGGTSKFMRPGEISELLATLGNYFFLNASAGRDFSIELDPRHVTPADIAEYARIGFNRASLGVQDCDPEVQRAVNRIQRVDETLRVIDACRDSGFRSVNVDPIGTAGLPDSDLIGFGMGAISRIGNSFSQNECDLPGWQRAIDEGRLPVWRGRRLQFDDVLRDAAIQAHVPEARPQFSQVMR